MNLPYNFRIVGCLPGHEPVEFFRTHADYSAFLWSFHTRDIAPEWTVWTEFPMANKYALGGRVTVRQPSVAAVSRKNRLHLTYEEKITADITL
jgi:hypothetical protein